MFLCGYMGKKYTEDEMEILGKNPNVKHVRENRLTLTYEFRHKLWEKWKDNQSVSTIRKTLTENGFDTRIVGGYYIRHLNERFKKNGEPSSGKNVQFGVYQNSFHTSVEGDAVLLASGKFEKCKRGIRFTEEFKNLIFHSYPQKSIEETLAENNLDIGLIGYLRIYSLKRVLDGETKEKVSTVLDDTIIEKYLAHPYVKRISKKRFVLKDEFYEEASIFEGFHIDEILNIFGFQYEEIPTSARIRIKYKLHSWNIKNLKPLYDNSSLFLRILKNKNEAMTSMIENEFKQLKDLIPEMSKKEKKKLCEWIRDFTIEGVSIPVSSLYTKLGISKSNYYSILKNDSFCDHEERMKTQEELDIEVIRKVLNSEIYPMGYRMVYMKMQPICGKQIGLNKVRRLMKKYNLSSTVRTEKTSRKGQKELLKRNTKPNILKRKFRFSRPLSTFLSDVAYLKFGSYQTAYFSPVKDASSGRILGFELSESNDLKLVEDTLLILQDVETGEDVLLHTDQGALYLTDSFQQKVKELGLRESMSRRGNCWDNASQESFFGHFRDECDFKNCSDINEVRKVIEDYIDYYNNRRPQWTRNRMTPVQFEKYLLEMSEEEFIKYQEKVKAQYDIMIENAKIKAIKRAHDIGAME